MFLYYSQLVQMGPTSCPVDVSWRTKKLRSNFSHRPLLNSASRYFFNFFFFNNFFQSNFSLKLLLDSWIIHNSSEWSSKGASLYLDTCANDVKIPFKPNAYAHKFICFSPALLHKLIQSRIFAKIPITLEKNAWLQHRWIVFNRCLRRLRIFNIRSTL